MSRHCGTDRTAHSPILDLMQVVFSVGALLFVRRYLPSHYIHALIRDTSVRDHIREGRTLLPESSVIPLLVRRDPRLHPARDWRSSKICARMHARNTHDSLCSSTSVKIVAMWLK